MDLKEFRNEFDVLFNNVTSNQAPGLDSYEISVFLTKAEHQLVDEYFNVRIDGSGGGFDGTPKRQYDFSSIIRTADLFYVNTFKERISPLEKLHKGSLVYILPKDFYLTVNEIISDSKHQYAVLPIKYSEYHRLMCKPYNYPPKKSAWRIITDKKNCNYFHYVIEGTDVDYTFTSTWADQKRRMKIKINTVALGDSIQDPGNSETLKDITLINGTHPQIKVNKNNLYFKSIVDELPWEWYRISCGSKMNGDVYTINLTLYGCPEDEDEGFDDEESVTLIKHGFYLLSEYLKAFPEVWNLNSDVIKTMTHTDGFKLFEAPSHKNNFSKQQGFTMETEVIPLSLVEVIGKFDTVPTYRLRYVKTLKPIILEDLDIYGDLSIEGETKACECELPEETHHEILERAVALAKITWAGTTATQAKSKE